MGCSPGSAADIFQELDLDKSPILSPLAYSGLFCYHRLMSIRDDEIKRIVKYANGLGIKVTWKKYVPGSGDGASWSVTGDEITMYVWPKKSKVHIILDFVHELAHHMAWIESGRKVDDRVNFALGAEANRSAGEPPIPVELRRIIYEAERSDMKYQNKVFKELDLKIPIWRFKAAKKLDLWVYRRYMKDGDIPTEKEINAKRREIHRKLRKKYEQ